MRVFIATALGCAMLSGIGCAGSAKFVQQTRDGGVIELQAGGSEAEVAKLAEQQFGKGCKIDKMPTTSASGNFNPAGTTGSAQAGQSTLWQVSKKATGTTPAGLPAAQDNGVMPASYQTRPGAGTMNPGSPAMGGGVPTGTGMAPMSATPTGTVPGASPTTGSTAPAMPFSTGR